jgi:D-alanyl-D-alanine carboxypeptidase
MEQLRLRLDALTGVPGAAVAASVGGRRQEAAVGSAAGRPLSPDTPFRIASLTKTLTAAATVMACRDRGCPLDVPLVELLPQLADDWRAAPSLSLAQVLGQVSGLRESVDDGDPRRRRGRAARRRAARSTRHGTRCWDRPAKQTTHGPDAPAAGCGRRSTTWVAFGEWLLADRVLLDEIRRPRTPAGSPMPYGLGWALGPSGQLYVNGRLPGYRAVLLMVPDTRLVIAALANDGDALPALAAFVSDLQRPVTGHDLAEAIDGFAA